MAGTPGVTGWRGRAGWWAGSLVMVSVAMLGLSGCGGDSSETGGDAMAINWFFTPEPATAVVSDDEGFDWVAPYRVTLTETGGQGGTVTDVNINVYEAVDGELGELATSADSDLVYQSTRIEARGTLNLDLETHYTLANEGRVAFIDVFVFIIDDVGRSAQIGSRLAVE